MVDERTTYTKAEVAQLLNEAARTARRGEGRYTLDEVQVAAGEAGIPAGPVAAAAERLDRRRGLRLALLAAAAAAVVGVLALILWPPAYLGGWRRGSLLLQNEHRFATYDVELLVPAAALDCRLPPTDRAAAGDYRPWRTVRLEPGARLAIDAPPRTGRCAQVWVRTWSSGVEGSSALFELPAGIEIERTGRLDQRGAGHPQMYEPPPAQKRRST